MGAYVNFLFDNSICGSSSGRTEASEEREVRFVGAGAEAEDSIPEADDDDIQLCNQNNTIYFILFRYWKDVLKKLGICVQHL